MTKTKTPASQEVLIASKIITIREERVILDVHLAELYEVETRTLKQAVRRNMNRFPKDFMYELTGNEIDDVVSQNVIPSRRHLGGAIPFAFTDNGIAMLSSILNSKRAIEVNIAIMRTFTMLKKMLLLQKDFLQEIEKVKKQLSNHDSQIMMIFEYLKQFEETKQQKLEQTNRKLIGFDIPDKK